MGGVASSCPSSTPPHPSNGPGGVFASLFPRPGLLCASDLPQGLILFQDACRRVVARLA